MTLPWPSPHWARRSSGSPATSGASWSTSTGCGWARITTAYRGRPRREPQAQSALPVALGLMFTRWELGFINALSAGLTLASGVVFLGFLLRKASIKAYYLLGAGTLYMRSSG